MLQQLKSIIAYTIISSLALASHAGWIGVGTPDGTNGDDFNDPANWADATLDGNFSDVNGTAHITFTDDYTADQGLEFSLGGNQKTPHITFGGNQTITINSGYIPGHTYLKDGVPIDIIAQIWLSSNLLSTVTFEKDLTFNLAAPLRVTGRSTVYFDSFITGASDFMPSYARGHTPYIVMRNDANNFTGNINGDQGYLFFTSVANSSLPSALGAGERIYLNNYPMFYIGTRDQSTDRRIDINNLNSPGIHNNSASASLTINGKISQGATGTKMHLGGISEAENLLVADITNHSSAEDTRLIKQDSTTWRLTGNNTFSRNTTKAAYDLEVNGGTLIADYQDDIEGAGINRLMPGTTIARFATGSLIFGGKTGTGNSTLQELDTLVLHGPSLKHLKLEVNDGDSTTLAIDNLVGSAQNFGGTLFEVDANSTIKVLSDLSEISGSVVNVDGVLMSYNGKHAALFLKDATGKISFASQDEDGTLIPFTPTLELTADNSSNTTHVKLSSSLVRTEDLTFSTLEIDASNAPITLDLGGKKFLTDNSSLGRTILVSGSHPVTITKG